MGSKSKIVEDLLDAIPPEKNFYDLFGGGFAVSHCALLSGKYKNIHYNEIKSDITKLVRDSISGKYSYKHFLPPWISRADFHKNKGSCAYTRLIWSFGNNQDNYLFGKSIELKKKSLHNAVIFGRFDDITKSLLEFSCWPVYLTTIKARRLFIKNKLSGGRSRQVHPLERLQQLQQLERLQQLEQLQQLQQLHFNFTSLDYAAVEIESGSVIYCDIPYRNTVSYGQNFDYDRFFNWAANHEKPIYISEYGISDNRFSCIFQKKRKQGLSSNGKSGTRREFIEKLYANKAALLTHYAHSIFKS